MGVQWSKGPKVQRSKDPKVQETRENINAQTQEETREKINVYVCVCNVVTMFWKKNLVSK